MEDALIMFDNLDLRHRIEILETIAVQGESEQGRRDGIVGARTLEQVERQQQQQVDVVGKR